MTYTALVPTLSLLTKHPTLTPEAKLLWAHIGMKTEFNFNNTHRLTLLEIIQLDSFLAGGIKKAITTLIQHGFLNKIEKEEEGTFYALCSPRV